MNIEHAIHQVFTERYIGEIPLFYVESGSRLWGMASPDSDYDVRGFHLQRPEHYFDYRQHRHLIEIMQGDFDFVSYDLDKMFGLLAKSNPSVLEWIRAYIIYFNQFPEWDTFVSELLSKVNYTTLYHHYLSLAYNQIKQTTDHLTYKKAFYSIRGLFSAELALQHQLPELRITSLFQQVTDQPLKTWAEQYLSIKQQRLEKELLSIDEQQYVLRLLYDKVMILQSQSITDTYSTEVLQHYLTEYSIYLKHYFYFK